MQHQVSLDPQYKLPKMRYKGDVPVPHVLRADAASTTSGDQGHAALNPLICEVQPQPQGDEAEVPSLRLPVNDAAAKAAAAAAASSSRTVAATTTAGEVAQEPAAAAVAGDEQEATLPVLQHIVEFEGRPVQRVRISVQLPAGAATTARRHPDALQVVVAGEVVRVRVPGCQPLVITMPLVAAAQGSAAELAADGSSLMLLLPVMTVSELVAAARRGAQRQQQVKETEGSRVMELD